MTIDELRSDLGALSVQLDAEAVEQLDQIWPGPGKPHRRTPLLVRGSPMKLITEIR
jgi:hypothetical protein